MIRFITIFAKSYETITFIPTSMIMLICMFIGSECESVKWNIIPGAGFAGLYGNNDSDNDSDIATEDEQESFVTFNSGYDALKKITESANNDGKIIYDSFMKVYSQITNKYIDVGAVLTKNHLYFTSPVNYQIWKLFQFRSQIDSLMSNDTLINDEISAKLINNLDMIRDDEIIMMKLVPQLIGYTITGINYDILLSEKSINSLFVLFKIPYHISENVSNPEDIEVISELKGIANDHKTIEAAIKDLSNRLPFEDDTNLEVAETMMHHIHDTEDDIHFDDVEKDPILSLKIYTSLCNDIKCDAYQHCDCKRYDIKDLMEITNISDSQFKLTQNVQCQVATNEELNQWLTHLRTLKVILEM